MLNTVMQETLERAEQALMRARGGVPVELASFDDDVSRLCDLAKRADLADRTMIAMGLQKLDGVLGELEDTLRTIAGNSRFTAGH